MNNAVKLTPGKKYKVVKPFTDYDGGLHPIGEIWVYEGTNFLPYHDGLSLFIRINNERIMYRFQWIKEEQADIIENFASYVKEY